MCVGVVVRESCLVQLVFSDYLNIHSHCNRYEILLLNIWASVQPACCLKMSVFVYVSVCSSQPPEMNGGTSTAA